MQQTSAASGVRRRLTWTPCAALRPYVAGYDVLEYRLGERQIVNPLPARSDCFLQFHLKQPYRVASASTGATHRAPARTLVGPHTRRTEDLIWTGDLKVFSIRFTPIGFRSIFGLPAETICDLATPAELVLGSAVDELEARLHEGEEHLLAATAEAWLIDSLRRQRADRSVTESGTLVLAITSAMRSPRKITALKILAAEHNLSLRRMERLFHEFVGVTPKSFAQLHRSNHALALKRAHPTWDWAYVAACSGYFDQAHLIREFRDRNGSTPAAFAQISGSAHAIRAQATQSPHPAAACRIRTIEPSAASL
jgi:methylphosphotriester-DNA--protein-cysteine methyltransferase